MKFGEIFDYRNAEEAKAFVGKKGLFSENLMAICKASELGTYVGILESVVSEDEYPFKRKPKECGPIIRNQFFRPILEEELMMTHRQLTEWLARGKGVYICDDSTMVGQKIVSTNYGYLEGQEDEPVEDYILIRRWRDTEWSKPTKAIYEEDCK